MTDAYLVLVPMTSLKDEDAGLAHQKDFGAALGEEGGLRMNKLSEESVASVEDNIWMVNPEWSYVEKSWVDADPKYWAPEPAPPEPHLHQRLRPHTKPGRSEHEGRRYASTPFVFSFTQVIRRSQT